MSGEPVGSRIATLLRALPPKAQPVSATVLDKWIASAEPKLGPEARGGRLGWLMRHRSRSPRFSAPSMPMAAISSSSRVEHCFSTA